MELHEHGLWYSTMPVLPFAAVDLPLLPSHEGYGFHSPVNSQQEKSAL